MTVFLRGAISLCIVSLLACNGGNGSKNPDSGSEAGGCVGLRPGELCGQGTSFPLGSIVGRVTSLVDGSGLKGVTVAVAAKPAVTTDDNGYYEIKDLAAGATYRLKFTLDGFAPSFGDGTLQDAAGNYPQGNALAEVNVAMAPANAGVVGKVFLPGGRPAAGASLGIDLRNLGFAIIRQTKTDANGEFSFTNLPGSPVGVPMTVVVQPFDQDGDGRADYSVVNANVTAFPGVSTRVDIDLRSAAQALIILSTTLDDGTHTPGAPIVFVFNRALVKDSTTVSLTDTDLGRNVAVTWTLDTSKSQLTVTPSGGPLKVGDNYRFNINARAESSVVGSFSRNFREVSSAATLPAVAGLTVKPTSVDWRTTSFTLAWTAVNGAASYKIFARDTGTNTAYQEISNTGAALAPSVNLVLPAAFDWLSADGFQTPFGNGTSVEFTVVPVDVIGVFADPASTTPVKVVDNTAPRVTSTSQSGNADNSAGSSAATVTLTVQFSEYMKATPPPTLTLPTGVTSSFALDPGLTSGVFTITIPAGTNATAAFTLTGGADQSGNAVMAYDGALRSQQQLATDPGFESGNLSAWSASTTGTASPPAIVASPVFRGSSAVRLGNAAGSIQSGQSQITQLMTVPVGVSQLTITIRYQTYTNFAVAGHDSTQCALYTSVGSFIGTIVSDYLNYTTYQTATASFAVTGNTSVRLTCYSYQDGAHISGVYLDDIQVLTN